MSGPHVVTLGCRLNAFEAEALRGRASADGLSDAVIVNTCAVTAEAERQARQAIRRLRRERPGARIIVTGCAAQVNPRAFAGMPEVDRVVGNADKLADGALADGAPVAVSDIMAAAPVAPPLIEGFGGRARAFVQVQQGCDHRCTFCIVPFARGPSRSVAAEHVVAQVARLVDAGAAEVVLTGVDISSWGRHLPDRPTLGDLVRRVLAGVPSLGRLRLSTLDPAAVDDALVRVLADDGRLMPHLHLSLQAADDTVLKRMKRRHTRAAVSDLCRRVRAARPDVAFGADLIAGFPTETDAMFARTLAAVDDLGLTYLHVFPYSPRPGTPAARMPTVPGPVRAERARRLRRAGAAALERFLGGRVGATEPVVVERGREGRSPHYAPVRLDVDAQPGTVLDVRVTGVADGHLIGQAP